MGGFDNTMTLKAQLHEQNTWIFVYQDEGPSYKGRQVMKLHGSFYIVISSIGELEKNKPLPVALTTSIACDLH